MSALPPELIELAARALSKDMNASFPKFTQRTWEQETDTAKDAFRGRAIVALTAVLPAIRENVIEAAAKECEKIAAHWDHTHELSQFNVAIDCASRIRSLKGEVGK